MLAWKSLFMNTTHLLLWATHLTVQHLLVSIQTRFKNSSEIDESKNLLLVTVSAPCKPVLITDWIKNENLKKSYVTTAGTLDQLMEKKTLQINWHCITQLGLIFILLIIFLFHQQFIYQVQWQSIFYSDIIDPHTYNVCGFMELLILCSISGFLTEIELSAEVRELLEPPYGKCTPNPNTDIYNERNHTHLKLASRFAHKTT